MSCFLKWSWTRWSGGAEEGGLLPDERGLGGQLHLGEAGGGGAIGGDASHAGLDDAAGLNGDLPDRQGVADFGNAIDPARESNRQNEHEGTAKKSARENASQSTERGVEEIGLNALELASAEIDDISGGDPCEGKEDNEGCGGDELHRHLHIGLQPKCKGLPVAQCQENGEEAGEKVAKLRSHAVTPAEPCPEGNEQQGDNEDDERRNHIRWPGGPRQRW